MAMASSVLAAEEAIQQPIESAATLLSNAAARDAAFPELKDLLDGRIAGRIRVRVCMYVCVCVCVSVRGVRVCVFVCVCVCDVVWL